MANKKHVALIKQGVDAWNEWRRAHPKVRPDLLGAPLFGANLCGADLREADLPARSGSGAARLAAIPAGESPANRGVQFAVVVISSGGTGDQPVGSLDVKAPGGWGNSVRSVQGGEQPDRP